MMIRRLTPVAMLLVAVLTMGVGIAEAQPQTVWFLRFAPKGDPALDSSFVDAGRTIVVLQNTGESYTAPRGAGGISEVTFLLYDAVTIDLGSPSHRSSPAIPIQIGLFQTATPLRVGTRLGPAFSDTRHACVDADNQVVSCSSAEASFSLYVTGMEIVSPGNSSPVLFTSTATVTDDSLGVITGQQDENGFAEVVVTNKGEKPKFATLQTDEPLEPTDRIVEIMLLDYDPETGLAVYGGFLEY
jgi:hypothetical protein